MNQHRRANVMRYAGVAESYFNSAALKAPSPVPTRRDTLCRRGDRGRDACFHATACRGDLGGSLFSGEG